jgi:hypothetical protein
VRFFELEFLFGRGQGYSQSESYANCYFGTHFLITLFVNNIFLLNYMLVLLASSIGMSPTIAVLMHKKEHLERRRGVKEVGELEVYLDFAVVEGSERSDLFYVEYSYKEYSWRQNLPTEPFRYERTAYYVANDLFKSEASVKREVETNAVQANQTVRDDIRGVISVKAAKIVPLL